MKKIWWLIFLWLLIGCSGKTEAIVLSPTPRDITSPTELPEELRDLPIYWQGHIITLGGVPVLDSPIITSSEDTSLPCYAFSHDRRYFAYCYDEWLPEEKGAFPGFPGVREKIGLWDLKDNKHQELFEANPFGANPTMRGGVAFSPDDKKVLFAVAWQDEKGTDRAALASVDILSGEIEYLMSTLPFFPFEMDVSTDGKWAAMDISTLDNRVCLLIDLENKTTKCFTLEKGWYQTVKFTRNSNAVLYNHSKNLGDASVLYRLQINDPYPVVLVNGFRSIEILVVGKRDVVFKGATYGDYRCDNIYLISVDGSDFRRLSYLGEECLTEAELSR